MSDEGGLRAVVADDHPWMVGLNHQFVAELSPLDGLRLAALLREAFYARVSPPDLGFLITFDQAATYDSENFLWFRDLRDQFVYVDRIVVAPHARGRGLSRLFYEDLFAVARTAGHDRVVCEVNQNPPNPASDAFHAALGFAVIGDAQIASGKTVAYLEKLL
ncbi:MAG: GNAT family N-acetyltransferase [Pseudomonadota bacterium]